MQLRMARTDDIDAIATLHAQSWRHAYRGIFRDEFLDGDVMSNRLQVWLQRLSYPLSNQLVLVAEYHGEIQGFVCAFGNSDPQWGTFIDNLHVRQDNKRQGIGRTLMQAVAQWSEQNYPGIGLHLEVLAPNTAAQQFYTALGGRPQASWLWQPPGGGEVENLRFVWSRASSLLKLMD